jgi:hypothetical protein
MRLSGHHVHAGFVLAILLAAIVAAPHPARAQAPAVGDIIETNLNGQTVIGEVIRSGGGTVDLNLGQNNVNRFVQVQYIKVLQRAGTGEKSSLAIGDVVGVPYLAGTVMTGRIMKINGAYCEVDSSGSGFTGWSKCSELRTGTGKAGGGTAAAKPGAATASSKPPKPGLVSCAGKFEGRYAPSSGLPGVTIVFKAGKATAKGPLVDDEEFDCWTGNKKIYLHKAGQEDLEIDVNDDGTLDTPLGELKKKSS